MNELRDKIWYFLVDAKTNELLSSLIVKKYQKWDLAANIFLVLATSTSVTLWSIWRVYPTIWALIIGIAQIITLIKPYFIFPKYIKVFNEKGIRWQHLTVDLEKLWYEINQDMLSREDASESYFALKKQSLIFDTIPDDIIFFNHSKQQKLAENQCNNFLTKI